jgi:hypothetical protein
MHTTPRAHSYVGLAVDLYKETPEYTYEHRNPKVAVPTTRFCTLVNGPPPPPPPSLPHAQLRPKPNMGEVYAQNADQGHEKALATLMAYGEPPPGHFVNAFAKYHGM